MSVRAVSLVLFLGLLLMAGGCSSSEPRPRPMEGLARGPALYRYQIVPVAEDPGPVRPLPGISRRRLLLEEYEALPRGLSDWTIQLELVGDVAGLEIEIQKMAVGTNRGVTEKRPVEEGRAVFPLGEGSYILQDLLIEFRVPELPNDAVLSLEAEPLPDARMPLAPGRTVTTRIELRVRRQKKTKESRP